MYRSIRQGCPVLAILFFVFVMEILLTEINNPDSVQGFKISNTQNKYKRIQNADESTFPLALLRTQNNISDEVEFIKD